MLKAVAGYMKDEVWPRKREILTGGELGVALLVGIGMWFAGRQLPLHVLPVEGVVGMLLTYAAIALGFCVAGMTIALTLPNSGFTQKLVRTSLKGRKTNAYSDLLFVFSWTAIVHWVLIVVLVAVQVGSRKDAAVLPLASDSGRRIAVSVVAVGAAYALCQFLITLITLSEVGKVYCNEMREGAGKG